MEYHLRLHAQSAALVITLGVAVSLITSTVVASRAYRGRAEQQARSEQEMTVKGSARMRVRSDLGVWNIQVSGDGPDLQHAYEVLEFGVERVRAFLSMQGFGDAEIGLSAIDTCAHHARDKDGRDTDQVSGYTLARRFTVTTASVDRVCQAAGEVTQILRENIKVASSAPEYLFTKAADMKVKILGEASRDARDRAVQIGDNAGCSVGEVRRAQMGVVQITQPNSTEVSGMGMYDTATIDKDISVVVTVTFAVEAR